MENTYLELDLSQMKVQSYVQCNACRGRKKDTMTFNSKEHLHATGCKDSCLVQEAWRRQTDHSIIWDSTLSISTCHLKARGKFCIPFNT